MFSHECVKRVLTPGVLLATLAGCAERPDISQDEIDRIDFSTALAACCADVEVYPTEFIHVAEATSLWVVPVSRAIHLRDAFLQGQPAAQAHLLAQVRPMDLVLFANRSRASGANGLGYFGHSAIYLGGEADLRALGIWDHPLMVAHQQAIRDGAVAIESVDEGVHLSSWDDLMEADSAAVLRPQGLSRAEKYDAVLALLSHMGRPFDEHFDLATDDEIFCTELIYNAFPQLNLPVRQTYGRQVLWPDEIATNALLGKTRYQFIDYVLGSASGWRAGGKDLMAAKILQAWPDVAAH